MQQIKKNALLLIIWVAAFSVYGQIQIGEVKGIPGEKVRTFLVPAEDVDGTPLKLPIVIVTGNRPGPVVWIQALTHGDEYGGAVSIQKIVATLNPSEMSGTVVALMVANPAAFQALQRVNPNLDDRDDLGRVFPGAEKFATQRVAAVITRTIHEIHADYFIDLHTGGDRFRQLPFILYTPGGSVSSLRYDSLARNFGVPYLWRDVSHTFAGGPTTVMSEMGIPSFLVEIGGGQPLDSKDIDLQTSAVFSFLRGAGVLNGSPARLKSFTVFSGYKVVTNARGGFFNPKVNPGDRLHSGDLVGTITNIYGEVVEQLKSPADALVVGISTYPAWSTGAWLMELGTEFVNK